VPAVEAQKKSKQWQKDDGQYIPNPSTWLNQGRWDDELEAQGQVHSTSKPMNMDNLKAMLEKI
jgi:hypothetical protein